MGRRPSVATVLAGLALFVSLSANAFAASVIITNNSQVAPHVIAGAKAPAGDKQNLVPRSLGAPDLHAGAVTKGKIAADAVDSSKVADGTLTGDDIAPGTVGATSLDLSSIEAALKVVHVEQIVFAAQKAPLYAAGIWIVEGECVDDGGGSTHAQVVLSSAAEAFLAVNGNAGEAFIHVAATHLAETPSGPAGQVRGGDFTARAVSTEDFLSGRVLAATGTGACLFRFDGTSGP